MSAQDTGRILGTISDASGAAVADAQITVTSENTGTVRNIVSGRNGEYNVPQVPAGSYSLEVMAQGFSRTQVKNVVVTVGSDSRMDLKLQVGSVSEAITVNEELPLIDTTSSSLGSVVDERRMTDLPLNGRNWVDLTLMQPGIAQFAIPSFTTTGGNIVIAGFNGTIYSSNGGSVRSNFYSLDGANMRNLIGFNAASVTNTSLGVDGIKEYKVVTSMFSAEYGLAMGSHTIIVSKGGTNQFHGDVFEYMRNSSLDARNYFDALDTANINGFGTDKSVGYPGKRLPPFKRNNFGGAFGGPIRRDKTFFYAVYEGIRQRLGLPFANNTIPKACFVDQNGNLQAQVPAQIRNVNSFGTCASGAPATITVNSAILPLAQLFPAPNVVGASTFNFAFPYVQPTTENYGQMRVDHTFSADDTFFARYTQDNADTHVASQPWPNYFQADHSASHFATLSETHIFNPVLLNTVRFSYSRTFETIDPTVEPASLVKPNVQFVPGKLIGQISPGSGVTTLGTNNASAAKQDIYTLSDDIFWTKDKHALKFGTLINHFRPYPNLAGLRVGSASFANLASFFSGNYQTISLITPQSNIGLAFRYNTFGFYTQDDYRFNPRLTLNLGLRYEFATLPIEPNPNLQYGVYNPLTDASSTHGNLFKNNSLHNFSPRLGFAWDVFGKGTTSIKGGSGIYYDVGNYGSLLNSNSQNMPPFVLQLSLNNTLTTPLVPFAVPLPIPPNTPPQPKSNEYDLQQPTLLQYNLQIQQQLPWGMALTVGYVGSRGWHLYQAKEGDPVRPVGFDSVGLPIYGCWNAGGTAYVLPGATGACPSTTTNGGPFLSTGPRINPAFSQDFHAVARGDSYYNALQMQLNKRVTKGLQFQFSYTYSKLIDDGQGITNREGSENGAQLPLGYNQRFDRGRSQLDITHSVRANMIYHIPNVPWKSFASGFLNGWWMSSIISAQSGYPFSATLNSDRALQGAGFVTLRPDIGPTFDKDKVIKGTVAQWFDPTMFSLPVAGHLGNAGRNILPGPGLFNVDFSLVKDSKVKWLGEAGAVQFRAETFNILNHANFNLPSTTAVWSASAPASGVAGPIGSTGIPQFATAGQITSTVNNSRQIQLALKLIF